MSDNPIILTYKAKKEIAIATSASALTPIQNMAGRIQVRIVNYGSDRVAYSFDGSAADITKDPTLPAGAVEVVTVRATGGALVCSVQGAAAGGVFEVTPCAGD